jgi:hypothetical protein
MSTTHAFVPPTPFIHTTTPSFVTTTLVPSQKNPNHEETSLSNSAVSRSLVLQTLKGLLSSSILLSWSNSPVTAYPQPNYSYEGRPTYLTEPTEEFQDNEKRADSFRREQLRLKEEFKAVLDDFVSTSYSSTVGEEESVTKKLIADMESMTSWIKAQQGLPVGIKKESLYKMIRAKKKEGIWPTSCEYT